MRLIFLVFLYQYSENAEYEIETQNISSNTRLFCEHPSSSQFFELKTELFFFRSSHELIRGILFDIQFAMLTFLVAYKENYGERPRWTRLFSPQTMLKY